MTNWCLTTFSVKFNEKWWSNIFIFLQLIISYIMMTFICGLHIPYILISTFDAIKHLEMLISISFICLFSVYVLFIVDWIGFMLCLSIISLHKSRPHISCFTPKNLFNFPFLNQIRFNFFPMCSFAFVYSAWVEWNVVWAQLYSRYSWPRPQFLE